MFQGDEHYQVPANIHFLINPLVLFTQSVLNFLHLLVISMFLIMIYIFIFLVY